MIAAIIYMLLDSDIKVRRVMLFQSNAPDRALLKRPLPVGLEHHDLFAVLLADLFRFSEFPAFGSVESFTRLASFGCPPGRSC